MVKTIHSTVFKNMSYSLTIGLLIVGSSMFLFNASGNAWQEWDDNEFPGWINPLTDKYYGRIQIIIKSTGGTLTNEPVQISPSFADNTCTENSIRILYYNGTQYIELPYITNNTNNYFPSGFCSSLDLIFVAPKIDMLGVPYYVMYSDDTDVFDSPPSYAPKDFSVVQNNYITSFYNQSATNWAPSLNFAYNGNENKTAHVYIPNAQAGLDVNVTNAFFNYSVSPKFYQATTPITIPGAFNNMGPTSIKFYPGSTYGNDWTYMLAGTPTSILIYNISKSGAPTLLDSLTVPTGTSETAQIAGMQFGDVLYGGNKELIFGTRNGTIFVYDFDGESIGTLRKEYRVYQDEFLNKTYAMAVMDIQVEDVMEDYTELIVAGMASVSDAGKMKTFWYNDSTNDIEPYNTFASWPADSIGTYSQSDNRSYVGASANFFPCEYYEQDPGTTYSDFDEFMFAFPQGNDINVGIYHPRNQNLTGNSNIMARMRDNTLPYSRLVLGMGGKVAYSKYFTNDHSTFSFAGLGNYGNDLYYAIKPLVVNQNSSRWELDEWSNGYLTFGNIYETSYLNYGSNAIFTTTWGNLDGIATPYEDILFVDNNGKYHMYTYDSGLNYPIRRITGSLLGSTLDLYGTGQSLDCIDYSGDGIADVAVADSNGKIYMLNYSFGRDIGLYTKINTPDTYNLTLGTTGLIDYGHILNISHNLKYEFNSFLGKDPQEVPASSEKYYTPCEIKIEAGSICDVELYNLNVTFETNDYTLVDPNRNVLNAIILENDIPEVDYGSGFPEPPSGITLEWADYDGDGLYDIFERYGRIAWSFNQILHPGFPLLGDLPIDIAINRTHNFTLSSWGQTLPNEIWVNWTDNDTDSDGLYDGEELLVYRCNSNVSDTDNDLLNDFREVKTYFTDPTNPDTDGDELQDGVEVDYYFCNPLNPNTDGDSTTITTQGGVEITIELSDSDEVNRYLNPSSLDSDGDGLSDVQELGIYDLNDPNTRLSHYLNSEQLPNGQFGMTVYYAKNDEFFKQYYPSYVYALRTGLDPQKSDTDGDGLTDYEEIMESSTFIFEDEQEQFWSSPIKNDTDGDGLLDGDESSKSFMCWQLGNDGKMALKPITVSLNPDNRDTDGDGIVDGLEIQININPLLRDTDFDFINDGEEYYGFNIPGIGNNIQTIPWNPDTDGDGLLDGEEKDGILYTQGKKPYNYFGKDPDISIYSDPTKKDTDGDGWSDFEEVMIHFTDPSNPDTDGDGVKDSKDSTPVLHNSLASIYYLMAYIAVIGAVAAAPLNWYSANKALARKFLYAEKISKATKRMARERREAGAFEIKANMIPTSRPDYFSVKLTMQIKDQSFFGRACRVSYSAGAKDYQTVNARKVSDEQYSFMLEEIPVDTRVLYFVEFLDRGGVWVRDDNEGKLYTFATNKEGTIDTRSDDEWSVERGVKCPVCGYLCLPEWDECPECNTPLHEDLSQELLLDEQKKKQAIQDKTKDIEAIAWEEAQKTDEVWRGLPPCPNCGVSVQPEWASCPVCGQSLKDVKLEKHAIYEWEEADADFIEGKDESEINLEYKDDTEATKSEKELFDEEDAKKKKKKDDAWRTGTDEDIDIL